MSYPSWPATLPQVPLAEGYSEVDGENVIWSSNDAGPPKGRRRSTADWQFITCSFSVTRTQLATAKAFYRTTLASVLPFTWTHPSTGLAANFRIRGLSTAPGGGAYVTMTLSLEVVP